MKMESRNGRTVDVLNVFVSMTCERFKIRGMSASPTGRMDFVYVMVRYYSMLDVVG